MPYGPAIRRLLGRPNNADQWHASLHRWIQSRRPQSELSPPPDRPTIAQMITWLENADNDLQGEVLGLRLDVEKLKKRVRLLGAELPGHSDPSRTEEQILEVAIKSIKDSREYKNHIKAMTVGERDQEVVKQLREALEGQAKIIQEQAKTIKAHERTIKEYRAEPLLVHSAQSSKERKA